MKEILRDEWNYDGFVVSDWDSVIQLITHGFSENEKEELLKDIKKVFFADGTVDVVEKKVFLLLKKILS